MAKKATTPARKRAKSTKSATEPSLSVQCVFRVGSQEFSSQEEADLFLEQHSRRAELSALAASVLEQAPVRGRRELKAGVAYLVEAIVANPSKWAAALAAGPGAAPKDAPPPSTVIAAPPRKRAASRSKPAASAGDAPKKKRVRRTRAQIAADEAAKLQGSAPPSTPAPEAPAPAAPPVNTLPPPPP